MREDRLKQDIAYFKLELFQERDPERRMWLLTQIRDSELELLNIVRASRIAIEGANSNLEKALAMIRDRQQK